MTALDPFWKIAVQQAEAAFEEQRNLALQKLLLKLNKFATKRLFNDAKLRMKPTNYVTILMW